MRSLYYVRTYVYAVSSLLRCLKLFPGHYFIFLVHPLLYAFLHHILIGKPTLMYVYLYIRLSHTLSNVHYFIPLHFTKLSAISFSYSSIWTKVMPTSTIFQLCVSTSFFSLFQMLFYNFNKLPSRVSFFLFLTFPNYGRFFFTLYINTYI